ncbi:MAG: hypothetical protein JWQ09_952 [Segetibacter sp.]|nr:hypothetical protein [Segetibacter sp.]
MPKYRCHKEVWALKIKSIQQLGEENNTERQSLLYPADEGYGPIVADHAYVTKHKPEVGGYYVVYSDGYRSFSPREAFEGGYTLIN